MGGDLEAVVERSVRRSVVAVGEAVVAAVDVRSVGEAVDAAGVEALEEDAGGSCEGIRS
ncbi:MAG: hypothetical protein OXC58_02245 [Acidimicrobiaceae bacterium]|nr:hypothetical protein [Acidimicrobiaceae bacterium]MCY4293651.1 hypothetical protein [Acidimicrobiaceae bacterium]